MSRPVSYRIRLPLDVDASVRRMVDGVKVRSVAHAIEILLTDAVRLRQEEKDARQEHAESA